MIKFVVHEGNRTLNKKSYARIHRASCGFTKEPNHETASSFCHGYFDTYPEALNFAESLDVEEVHECKFCEPRHTCNRRGRPIREQLGLSGDSVASHTRNL